MTAVLHVESNDRELTIPVVAPLSLALTCSTYKENPLRRAKRHIIVLETLVLDETMKPALLYILKHLSDQLTIPH